MSAKKKAKANDAIAVLATADGATHNVERIDGKWYVCAGGVRFRMSNPFIVSVDSTANRKEADR